MGTLPNKREVLQSILDQQDDLWIIMKPSRNDPIDPEDLCVFQNPGRWKKARVEIPMSWFLNQELEKNRKGRSRRNRTRRIRVQVQVVGETSQRRAFVALPTFLPWKNLSSLRR